MVKDKKFNRKKHANSWIFKNTQLTIDDVESANPLEDYRQEIQNLFDKYKITAYNKAFDLRFLKDRGFTCSDVKCLMKTATKYSELKDKNGNKKVPSMEEIFNQFFVTDGNKYVEEHRAGADAKDEAKLLLHMAALKDSLALVEDEVKLKAKAPQTNYPRYKPVAPDDDFPFGKYKGMKFKELAAKNPKYVKWCLENVKGFKLNDEAKKLIK